MVKNPSLTFNYSSFQKYSFLKAVFKILLILEASIFMGDVLKDSQSATHLISIADVILVIRFFDLFIIIQILGENESTHF